jgi:cell division protein FtsZ
MIKYNIKEDDMRETPMRITPAEIGENLTDIKVIGVGGGGGNALNHMIEEGIQEVEFIAVNTDAQDLKKNRAEVKIQIGTKLTGGRGTGGDPKKGEESARESEAIIYEKIGKANMIFITAGMGGGTGTGASPVIADIAKKNNILTVGVVTIPFKFEGEAKMNKALNGIEALKKSVNSLIIIPNDKVNMLGNGKIPLKQAFKEADTLLTNAVKGIADIITSVGFMNVDFEDVRTMMSIGGHSIMGMGEGEGEEKVFDAIKRAVENPLIDDKSIKGARGILVNFTCGEDTTIEEITKGVEYLTKESQTDAEIKFGVVIDEKYEGRIKATVIATGLPDNSRKQHEMNNTNRGLTVDSPPYETPVAVSVNPSQSSNVANWGSTPSDFEEPTFKRMKKGINKIL